MRTKHFMGIIFLCVVMASCYTIHKNFTLYKQPLSLSGNNSIRTNGIYFYTSPIGYNNYLTLMYFYNDGTISILYGRGISTIKEDEFWNQPATFMKYFKTDLPWNKTCGHYNIINDSIHIQCFQKIDQRIISHNSYDIYGKVLNDTTIVLTKEVCSWCEKYGFGRGWINSEYVYKPPVKYRFYQHGFKPDSSKFWFKNKKWYIEGLKQRDVENNK